MKLDARNLFVCLYEHFHVNGNPCQAGVVGEGAIPAVIGREAGYTLERSPVYHGATQRQPCTLTLTPRDNLESSINLT